MYACTGSIFLFDSMSFIPNATAVIKLYLKSKISKLSVSFKVWLSFLIHHIGFIDFFLKYYFLVSVNDLCLGSNAVLLPVCHNSCVRELIKINPKKCHQKLLIMKKYKFTVDIEIKGEKSWSCDQVMRSPTGFSKDLIIY